MSRAARVLTGLATLSLVTGLLIAPSAASTRAAAPAATQGVTKNQIQLVAIVADLSALKTAGAGVSSTSAKDQVNRWQAFADAFGPINGRKVVVKGIGWNPIDATSQSDACTGATQDNHPFAVIMDRGFQMSSVPCITVDNKTPYITADPGYAAVQKASGNRLVALAVPAEAMAKTTVQMADRQQMISKNAKIGILSNNQPAVKAAADTAEAELKKRGYNVVSKVEINGLSSDFGLIAREASAAADTFQSKEVDTVFEPQSLLAAGGYFEEANKIGAHFKTIAFDGQAGACNASGATFAPSVAADTPCITYFGTSALPDKSGIRPDSGFEAQCRTTYQKYSDRKVTTPGAASDYTINGVSYKEDFADDMCTIMNLLLPAIKKAGKDLTWDKVYKNMVSVGNGPVANQSGGTGGFAKNKPYYFNQVQVVMLATANASTPKDPNGKTFNGCPVPKNCWIPKPTNGKQWFKAAVTNT